MESRVKIWRRFSRNFSCRCCRHTHREMKNEIDEMMLGFVVWCGDHLDVVARTLNLANGKLWSSQVCTRKDSSFLFRVVVFLWRSMVSLLFCLSTVWYTQAFSVTSLRNFCSFTSTLSLFLSFFNFFSSRRSEGRNRNRRREKGEKGGWIKGEESWIESDEQAR